MSIINKGYTGGQLDDQVIIDHTDAEALLVRKDADGGDIFTVDTALSNVLVDARLKMGTSQPFWPAVGKAAGIQFLGTAATRAGIICDTDEGMSLVAGDNDGNGNHVVALVSGGNVLKDHDHDTFQTDPTLFIHSATDPDTDNTEYGSLRHDQTDFVIGAGKGSVKIENKLSYGAAGSLTIATGAVTVTTSYHTLVVEGGVGAGADTLNTAAGGAEGDILVLKTTTSGANDTVTIADSTGPDSFILSGGTNFMMDHVDDRIEFIHNGTEWVEKFRSDNS